MKAVLSAAMGAHDPSESLSKTQTKEELNEEHEQIKTRMEDSLL